MSDKFAQGNTHLQMWRTHFSKMASGQIPYTREFTVLSSSNQVGKGYAKNMEKMVAISPAAAAVEIAASSAEGYPHKATGTDGKKYKKGASGSKGKSKKTGKGISGKTEAF